MPYGFKKTFPLFLLQFPKKLAELAQNHQTKELHVCKSGRLLPEKANVCVEGRDQGVIRAVSRSGRLAFFVGNMTGPSVNKAFMTPCSGLGTMGDTGVSRAQRSLPVLDALT